MHADRVCVVLTDADLDAKRRAERFVRANETKSLVELQELPKIRYQAGWRI